MLKIAGDKDYHITLDNGLWTINGKEQAGQLHWISDREVLIQLPNKILRADILKVEDKVLEIKIGQSVHPLTISDELDILIQKMGLKSAMTSKEDEVKAPMPGLILEIRVKEGQKVKEGDILLILEAMKMENVIKASTEGEIKEILVEENQSVEKNQVLLRY